MHIHSNGIELRILMQIKLISLTIIEHQDSLRNRDKQQLGNGPFMAHAGLFTIMLLFCMRACLREFVVPAGFREFTVPAGLSTTSYFTGGFVKHNLLCPRACLRCFYFTCGLG